VIVDSSALVAIMNGEPEEDEFKAALARHHTRISAVTAFETAIVLGASRHHLLDELLADAELSVVAFDATQARLAREAYARYGRRTGSQAQLNFGDCMAYALAKVTGEPLLFKGDDFAHTDVTSARG
jgi:ribonuclease VapC